MIGSSRIRGWKLNKTPLNFFLYDPRSTIKQESAPDPTFKIKVLFGPLVDFTILRMSYVYNVCFHAYLSLG